MKASVMNSLETKTVAQAIETIRDRVDSLGVSEPVIQEYGLGKDQILVELPGIDDLDRVKSIIRDIKLPTKLSDAGVKHEMIERMVPQAMADASHPSNPRELTRDAARRLYEAAF